MHKTEIALHDNSPLTQLMINDDAPFTQQITQTKRLPLGHSKITINRYKYREKPYISRGRGCQKLPIFELCNF